MSDTPPKQPTNSAPEAKPVPPTVMSGMRPTGRLHIGHYFGVLHNWVALQADYRCYFMVADWHALTTQYDRTADHRQNCIEMVMDWLASGIDPARAAVYVQSSIPEIAELSLLLGMLTPVKWVETDPTLKDMVAMLSEELSYGLLGYPVLQTADILVTRAGLVPVGRDQVAHLEISRDLARRFNHVYQTPLFPEPRPLLTHVPVLTGVDGRKMGKSYGNAIYLNDTPADTEKAVRGAITDPARTKRDMPGNPDQCAAVYPYYQVFGDDATRQTVADECRSAQRGCVDCKKQLATLVNARMNPIREARQAITPADVIPLLKSGTEQVREKAADTLHQVRRAMQTTQF
jgi:tryptophanyl-tRNA synthetase